MGKFLIEDHASSQSDTQDNNHITYPTQMLED